MSLPGFTAEACLYKIKSEYKLYQEYDYQNGRSVSPANYMNLV